MSWDEYEPTSFSKEESIDRRRLYVRHAARLVLLFVVLFGAASLTLRWSGDAVHFGASRVADRGTATWHIVGMVRDAGTHQPVPWATVDDDQAGQPPFFHAVADRSGVFDLATLAEPHRVRIAAAGYRAVTIRVGRAWFLWLPRGRERHDLELFPGE